MKPATEEFLYYLLWSAEGFLDPTWRNVDQSFESWAYRAGINHRLRELERRKLIEKKVTKYNRERLFRLTKGGRLAALGGVDPSARWARPWDGKWHLVLFDVPEDSLRHRARLRRLLRRLGFGYLQDSVWVSTESPRPLISAISDSPADVEMLVLFEGQLAGGESNADLVRGAWDFEVIAHAYACWARVADRGTILTEQTSLRAETVKAWAAAERSAWKQICHRDPFLPAGLLPAGYPGRKAWARRVELLNRLGAKLG